MARKARTTLPRAAGGPRSVPWAPRFAHPSSTTPGRAAIHQGGAWEGATALFYHSRQPHRQKEVNEWLDDNQDAEKEDFDEKLKEVQDTCSPIISKVYQESGGAPGGGGDFGGDDDLDGHDEL